MHKKFTKAITRYGRFTARQIFSAALLTLSNPEISFEFHIARPDYQTLDGATIAFAFCNLDDLEYDTTLLGIWEFFIENYWTNCDHNLYRIYTEQIIAPINNATDQVMEHIIDAYNVDSIDTNKERLAFMSAVGIARNILITIIRKINPSVAFATSDQVYND